MRIPAGRTLGLSTRGRCLVAGGVATAVCAVVLDERDLIRVGIFVLALPLLALALLAVSRRRVRAERTLSPARIGADLPVTVEVRCRGGGLPGVLRVADSVPDAAGPAVDAPPRFVVHRLPRRGEVTLHYTLRPTLRGVHRIGPLVARATDPLGLAEFSRELSGADRLLVLPRVVELRGLPASSGAGEGASGSALAYQGKGASDVLVRPYRHGDELRRVHWRSTARHDELMVRLEERPRHGGTTVVLDRRDAAHRGRGAGSSLEFAVGLAASICVHLIGRGVPVSLVTEDGVELSGPAQAGGVDALLDALAALRPSARHDLTAPQRSSGTDLIVVLGAPGPGDLDTLLAHQATGGLAVLLDTADWDPAARDPDRGTDHAVTLRRTGWRVAVAGAGSTPEAVWDELTRAASRDLPAGLP